MNLNLVPQHLLSNYTQAITRAEFCALGTALYEAATGKAIEGRMPFSDTNDPNVEMMAAAGVVNGMGGNMFMPGEKLTREQAAVILSRLAGAAGKPLAKSDAAFADSGAIAAWANDGVGQVQAAGIMGGMGDGVFSPKGPFTREQSIVTIARLHGYIINAPSPSASSASSASSARSWSVPILMYHCIEDTSKDNELFVSPKKFEEQLVYLRDNGYVTITMRQLAEIAKSGGAMPPNAVARTLDDGYRNNFVYALPLLVKYGMCATMYMVSDAVYSEEFCTGWMLRQMNACGIEVGSHSKTHADLARLSGGALAAELVKPKEDLEAILQSEIASFAYPAGKYNEATMKAVKDAGYLSAVTTVPGRADSSQSMYALKRYRISKSDGLTRLANIVNNNR
jgi:peptidoglycan/xylan/chitin deacetylase (PgdA/CDA1 family)